MSCLPYLDKHLSLLIPIVNVLCELIHDHVNVYDSIGTFHEFFKFSTDNNRN